MAKDLVVLYEASNVETIWKTAIEVVPPLHGAIEQILVQDSEC